MNELFLICLSLSLSGSLIALVLISIRPVLHKLGKTWQYYLWLVVLMRLLIPFSADGSVIGGMFQQIETYFTTQHSDIEYPLNINDSDDTESTDITKSVNGTVQKFQTPTINAVAVKRNFLGLLWFTVAMFLFFRKIYGYWQFIKTIKRDCKIIEDNQLLSVLQTVCKEMGIKKKIVVCTNQLLMAPMLIGIIRPVVLLPTENICSTDLAYIFRHELIHYRRRDFLYKWLTEIAVCVHWFNPIVYWIRRIINQDCEFSCDERVICQLNTRERQAYGETLLDSINPNRLIVKNDILLSLNEDGKLIKERLHAIMNYRRKTKFIIFPATLLTAILLCGTVYAGAYTVPITKTSTLNETGNVSFGTAENNQQLTSTAYPDREATVNQSVVYENVTMYHPTAGEDTFPYIHDIRTNHTAKTIVESEVGMSAYDKNGNPLKINWNTLNSDEVPSFDYLYDWDSTKIIPGQTDNVDGGWTLNIYGTDQNVEKIEYVLYCDKKITFSDDTVWENPDYDTWLKNYSGKKVSIELLNDYYPYVQKIE